MLESGRQEIVTRTKELIQRTLDAYKTGIEVTTVNLQDVQRAERSRARAAGRDQGARGSRPLVAAKRRPTRTTSFRALAVPPCARSRMRRPIAPRKVADAEGEAQRFLKLLTEYERAPGVTRERLYIETIERVLASSKKVSSIPNGNGNLRLSADRQAARAGPARAARGAGESTMTIERPATTAPDVNRRSPHREGSR